MQQLACIRVLAGDDGVIELKADSDLPPAEIGRLLRILADDLQGLQSPRGSGSWGDLA